MVKIKQIESPSNLEVTDPVKIRMTMKQYGKEWSTKDENSKQARIEVGDKVYDFGKVKEVGQTKSGMDYKILDSSSGKTKTIMFAGTEDVTGKDGGADMQYIFKWQNTEQGEDAYKLLLNTVSDPKNANKQIYLTGHSLGGMNLQYAIARLSYDHPEYMKNIHADIYESPNIIDQLNINYKDSILNYQNQINNYTCDSDFIGNALGIWGYNKNGFHIGNLIKLEDHFNWGGNSISIHNLEDEQKNVKLKDSKEYSENLYNLDWMIDNVARMDWYSNLYSNNKNQISDKEIKFMQAETIAREFEQIISHFEEKLKNKLISTKTKVAEIQTNKLNEALEVASKKTPEEIKEIKQHEESDFITKVNGALDTSIWNINKSSETLKNVTDNILTATDVYKSFDEKTKNNIKNYKGLAWKKIK